MNTAIDNDNFHPSAVKRKVLIVDDDAVNREILGNILEKNYEVLFAENGADALELIRKHQETLSLILLDLIMPVMDGIEVLKRVKEDVDLAHIPVIVLTSDQESEVECLSLGAIDFIPKPYPQVDVILARVHRTIELSEDRRIIQVTERDTLTGLYTKEYFFRYAEQFDQRHKGLNMDAILIDVNHFHMINERYGKRLGDEILRKIGDKVRETVWNSGGIVSRKEADTFLIYCPHRDDYEELLDGISAGLADVDHGHIRVHLRMGVYANVDKTIDIEQRFDRAKTAADNVHGSYAKPIGIYDEKLNQLELFREQLVEEFPAALESGQFKVNFQPKFDIRPRKPVIAGAEALVRWVHPELGVISPVDFIPLFEANGLIQQVDHFVWNQTARQIRVWKDNGLFTVPVSVNVSRIDLHDPNILETLKDILDRYNLTTDDLYLEITESAYTQDSVEIISVVKKLRDHGFHIEMDDFGTGYSSLNMISKLPIDALKLDMQFIRDAFREGGSTRMLEVVIDIAEYLGVPSIAEGVETEDQVKALRMMGCDLVQGFYFSKPIPADEFSVFLQEGKAAREKLAAAQKAEKDAAEAKLVADIAAMRQTDDVKEQQQFISESSRGKAETKGVPLRVVNIALAILAVVIAALLMIVDTAVNRVYKTTVAASDRLTTAQLAAFNMEAGSDFLTDRVRTYAVSGNIQYMQEFFEEVEVTRRRDKALADLEELMLGSDNAAYESLSEALRLSNELIGREYKAMRLRLTADSVAPSEIPDALAEVSLTEAEQKMFPDEQVDAAISYVFDDVYMGYKQKIKENVSLCTKLLLERAQSAYEQISARTGRLLRFQTILTILLLVIVLTLIFFISTQVRQPLTKLVESIRAQLPSKPSGAEEMRFVSRAYNDFLADSQKAQAQLTYEAAHDPLTGLFNRRAYELLVRSIDIDHVALLVFDVDQFKKVNDTYGQEIGDLVLKRVAAALKGNFRSVDIICRMSGDEFVVIMTRMNRSMQQLVKNKFILINKKLQNAEGEVPSVSVSAGVAFSDRVDPHGDLLEDAYTALRKAQNNGRKSCEIF